MYKTFSIKPSELATDEGRARWDQALNEFETLVNNCKDSNDRWACRCTTTYTSSSPDCITMTFVVAKFVKQYDAKSGQSGFLAEPVTPEQFEELLKGPPPPVILGAARDEAKSLLDGPRPSGPRKLA